MLVSETQAAERLGLSIRTLRGWRAMARQGRHTVVPYHQLEGLIRYDTDDLDGFLAKSKVGGHDE